MAQVIEVLEVYSPWMKKKSKSLSGSYIQGNHIESQNYRMDDITRDL